jgi:predicted HicB family RNase H-like nuclease
MTDQNEAWVQLATRIPRRLHREMKLHCVAQEVSLMAFVVEALREKLAADSGETQSGRRGRRAS